MKLPPLPAPWLSDRVVAYDPMDLLALFTSGDSKCNNFRGTGAHHGFGYLVQRRCTMLSRLEWLK
eukprot:4221915-Amphidinium_carterae.1